uniref:Glutathione S-transferase T3 n=1 Tax=Noccaea caerulescens TaxID=107243 RepID=A0A1J3HNP1_NOCCA
MDPYSQSSMDPYRNPGNFVNLLTSQQEPQCRESFLPYVGLGSSQDPQFGADLSDQVEVIPESRGVERRKWSPTEDIVLCSSWLNTSKDPVVGNEQKGEAFWKRISDCFNSSPNLAGYQRREANHCKQRWHRINEHVNKFVGCYEAAERQKTSGYNESDVMKVAYDIFFADNKVKFNLEHAWIELRDDQKWLTSLTCCKGNGSSKKKKVHDPSASSQTVSQPVDPQARPMGVKAAKAKGKRSVTKSGTAESTVSIA